MTSRSHRAATSPGEDGATRVVTKGALHLSRGQATTKHAHYAWKLHVGIDAPVWLDAAELQVPAHHGARAILVPPGVQHSTGAVGWSMAVFIAPGSRGTPWRSTGSPLILSGHQAQRLIAACHGHASQPSSASPAWMDQFGRSFLAVRSAAPDRRVRLALDLLAKDPARQLQPLATSLNLSLDRLSHLVSAQTGMTLKQHALWSRLLKALSLGARAATLAEVAHQAGFSDHAHMTRTYRRFLGRVPSEFTQPPDVIAPW